MHKDKFVFSQLVQFMDRNHFNYLVRKYEGDKYIKSYTCWNQLLTMIFGQLSNRESLRNRTLNGCLLQTIGCLILIEVQGRIICTLFHVSGGKGAASASDGHNGYWGEKKYGINKSGESYGCFVFPYVGSGSAAIRLLSFSGISYLLTLRSSRYM